MTESRTERLDEAKLSRELMVLKQRVQAVIAAWRKWQATASPAMADYRVLREALTELEQEASE